MTTVKLPPLGVMILMAIGCLLFFWLPLGILLWKWLM